MGLPAPAQGTNGKRVHVDPKGGIGVSAVRDAHQRIPSTDLDAASPALMQSCPHGSSTEAFRTCTGCVAPLAHGCGSTCCLLTVQPLPVHMRSTLPHADFLFFQRRLSCTHGQQFCPLAWTMPCRTDLWQPGPSLGEDSLQCCPACTVSHLLYTSPCLPGPGIVIRCTACSLLHSSQRLPEVRVPHTWCAPCSIGCGSAGHKGQSPVGRASTWVLGSASHCLPVSMNS